ncbi:MAG TPA: hypothetical protein VFG01_09790, partial [Acidobacteriota bacterium]|nr:hypothetical protein [Acidobacteriota bacterium]
VDWKEAQLINIDGLYRVKEGNELERQIKIEFSNIGYEVNLAQRYFRNDEYQISGRIDGAVPLKRELPGKLSYIKELPIEIKTINPVFWQATKTILDLRRNPKFWINKIPSQLNTYLCPYMMSLPAGFIVLITFGKRPRILPMLYDPELAEADLGKAKKVNGYVEKGEYPEPIPYDPSVCDLCPFNHMCDPPRASNLIQINQENRWELEDFLLLQDHYKQYKKLKDELIGSKKKPGKYYGKNAIFEDIEIKSNKRTQKKYDIPKKEKDKFFVETDEYFVTKIERVGKEQ